MVIDVDEVVLLQAGQAGALHAIAFQDDDRLGLRSVLGGLQHRIAERQRAVDARHAIAEDDVRLFAHAAQNLAAGQRRANRIAIRPGVRGENELLPSADLIQNFVQHPSGPDSNLTLPFLNSMQQLFDPAAVLIRVVEHEDHLRGLADAQDGSPAHAECSRPPRSSP